MIRMRVVIVGSICVILGTGVAWSAPVSVDDARAEQKGAAQKMFEAGDELYESGRYDEAAQAFRASYGIVASPNSRLMLARALRDGGHFPDAFTEYQGTIADAQASGGRYDEALTSATAESEALRSKLAFITVTEQELERVDEVRIGDRRIALIGAMEIPVAPGQLTLELLHENAPIGSETVALEAGERHVLGQGEVAPIASPTPTALPNQTSRPSQPPQPMSSTQPSSALRTGALIAGGVGVVGLASFGVLGYLAREKHESLDDACPDGACPASKRDDIDAGRLYQTLANVGLGVGVLGLATGATLYLFSGPNNPESASVHLGVGFRRVDLSGRF